MRRMKLSEFLILQMLYIDPWSSRQSEILWAVGENKQKQSHGWTECVDVMKWYIGDHVRYRQSKSQSWVSVLSPSLLAVVSAVGR